MGPTTCSRCLRKAVCMLYFGELDARFAEASSEDIVGLITRLDVELAQGCEFYLEEDRLVRPHFER